MWIILFLNFNGISSQLTAAIFPADDLLASLSLPRFVVILPANNISSNWLILLRNRYNLSRTLLSFDMLFREVVSTLTTQSKRGSSIFNAFYISYCCILNIIFDLYWMVDDL
jgi:hypothetical protein